MLAPFLVIAGSFCPRNGKLKAVKTGAQTRITFEEELARRTLGVAPRDLAAANVERTIGISAGLLASAPAPTLGFRHSRPSVGAW
jgi:hypothetical protein